MSYYITPFALITVFVAALGGFTLGFDAGFAVDGKDQVSSAFHLTTLKWSIITCMSILGSLLSVPISGQYIDKLGSKKLLQFAAAFFILGLGLSASAHNVIQLMAGRFIVGLCVGIASYSAPMFISEISPPSIRGGLILLNGVAITAGQAISFLVGYFIHDWTVASWRVILALEILPAVLLTIGMLYMPQSPRWAAKQLGIDSARDILKKIRPNDPEAIDREMHEINNAIASRSTKTKLKTLFSKKVRPVLFVGACLGVLQQFIGISAIMYYGPVVFQALGFNTIKEGILATFFISLINTCLTILSAFLIDYLGRRFLLLIGTFVAAFSLFFIGLVCLGKFNSQWGLFFVASYIIGYCIGLGSLFWVVVSEIFPTDIRGAGMSFVTTLLCAANFFVSITCLLLFKHIGTANTFFLYCFMSVIAFFFIYFFVPETKGVSLESIEKNLKAGKKVRQLGLVTQE